MKEKRKGSAASIIAAIAAFAVFSALFYLFVRPLRNSAEEMEKLAAGDAPEAVTIRESEDDYLTLAPPRQGGEDYKRYIVTTYNEKGDMTQENEYSRDGVLLRHVGRDSTEEYVYNDDGNIVRYTSYSAKNFEVSPRPSSCIVHAYNSDGRETARYTLHYSAGPSESGFTVSDTELYSYDEHGNYSKIVKTRSVGPVSTETFKNTYDSNGNLIKVVARQDDADDSYCNTTDTYKYDERGNVIEYSSSCSGKDWDGSFSYRDRETYEYDEYDRLTMEKRYYNGAIQDTYVYIYRDNGILKEKDYYSLNATTPSHVYNYDDEGNVINDDINLQEEFDGAGRLVKSTETDNTFTDPKITQKEYEYDADGMLVRVVSFVDDRVFERTYTTYEEYKYIY